MFETILVYILEASADAPIIQEAACVARNTQANIIVYHPFASNKNNGFVDPLNWSMRKAEAETNIQRICELLAQERIQAYGEVVEDESMESFMDYARKNHVSMIITDKSSSMSNNILSELMKSSSIPVLSIPESMMKPSATNCFKRILVPLDGSKRAEIALPFAISLSEKLNSEVLCVHVVQPPSLSRSMVGNDEKMNSLSEQLVETSRQNAHDYLKQVTSRFSAPIYGHVIVSGDVVSSLHQLIEDEAIDLVVLSAHGTSGNPKWPFGSIANNLLAYSLAPVLLIQDLPLNQPVEELMAVNMTQRKNR